MFTMHVLILAGAISITATTGAVPATICVNSAVKRLLMSIPLEPRNVVTGLAGSTKVEPIAADAPPAPVVPLRTLIGALVERARDRNGLWRRTNPHTGRPHQGKRQPAGAKLARMAYEQRCAKCW